MAFSILPCEDADMYTAFVLISETFEHEEPFHDALWPEHWTPKGREVGASRFRASRNEEPNLRFLKAVEASSGKIAGLVRYYVLPEGASLDENDLQSSYWSNEDDEEYARYLYRQYMSTRRRTVKKVGTPFICLDILSIHPTFQSRGVGSALVKWGTDLADSMNAEMSVESSLKGLSVYKKYGYRIVEEITLPVPEKWQDRPKVHFWFMRRGKHGKQAD